ncbi:uncharacterized protein LOC143020333 [Oratosquilla oratoria]|uniref:uncharacterized protein LOC143020333 n=1 Tax=Oratosquilla oratoria TaxID=337810 RepID=UPI003F777047
MFPCATRATSEPPAPADSRNGPTTPYRYSVCRNSTKYENKDGCSGAAEGDSRSEIEPAEVGRMKEEEEQEKEPCGSQEEISRGRRRQRAGILCAGVVLLLLGLAAFDFKELQGRSRRAAFTPPTVTSLRPPDRSGNGTHRQVLRVEATRGHPAITSYVGPTRSGTDGPQNTPGRNPVHRETPNPELISFEPLGGGRAASRPSSGVGEPGVTLSPKEAKNRKRTFAVEEGAPVYRQGFSGSLSGPVEGVGFSRQGQAHPRQEGARLEEVQQQGRPLPAFHGRHRLQEGSLGDWRHSGHEFGRGQRQDTFGHSIVEDLSHLPGGSSRDAEPKQSHRRSQTKSPSTPSPLPPHPSPQFPTKSYHPGASYTPRNSQHLYPKHHRVDDVIDTENRYTQPLGHHPTTQGHRQGHPLESQDRKMGLLPETRSQRRPNFQEELAKDIVPGNGGTSHRTRFNPVEGQVVEDRTMPSSRTNVMKIASGDIDSGGQIGKLLKMMNISYARFLGILKQKGIDTDHIFESLDNGGTLEDIQLYLEQPMFPEENEPPRSYPIEDPSLVEESLVPQSPLIDEDAFEFDDKERRVEDLLFLDDEDNIESVPADSLEYMESPERPQRRRKHRKDRNRNKKRNGNKGRGRNKNKHRNRHQKERHFAELTTSTMTPPPVHVSTAFASSTSTTSASFQEELHKHTTTPKPESTPMTEEVMTTTTTMVITSEQDQSHETDSPTLASEGEVEEDLASVVAVVVEEVVPDGKNQPEFYEPTHEEVSEDIIVSETVIEEPKEEYVFPIRGILILSGVMGAMAMFTLVVLVFYAIVKCSKRAPVNNYQVSSKNREPLKAIQAYA